MKEIWKQIPGYEDRYEISNLGRVRSFVQSKGGKIIFGSPSKKGYIIIKLYNKFHKSKTYPIHRLVAQSFIPNPENLPQVNHKDENKENNSVNNLEWCTNEYNATYGTKISRVAEKLRCCPSTSKRVYSIDSNGVKRFFESIGEAERQTGPFHGNIVRALKGRRPSCGGFKWCYAS